MAEHTVKAYSGALDQLTAAVSEMGGLAVSQVADAVLALTRHDPALAQVIVGQDAALDRMDAGIEQDAVRLIALRQPMAQDLRHIVAAMKIAGNLERCGDLAKNVAKRAVALADAPSPPNLEAAIERIGRLANARLKQVVQAFAERDADAARRVWSDDREIDVLYDGLFREILGCMQGDPDAITTCAHLLFVAKNLERVGDHATNIAELVVYEITGEDLSGSNRPKWDALTEI